MFDSTTSHSSSMEIGFQLLLVRLNCISTRWQSNLAFSMKFLCPRFTPIHSLLLLNMNSYEIYILVDIDANQGMEDRSVIVLSDAH